MATATKNTQMSGLGTVAAGLAGAAVGATAAVVLSDKNNRAKITDALQSLKDKGEQMAQDAKVRVSDAADTVSQRAEEVKGVVEEKSKDISKDVRKTVANAKK